ncbi:MAG: XdhC family protein [Oscillospiraceae bacterium]|nr:XdhC family protein [Oscillospiraceae bacterium]
MREMFRIIKERLSAGEDLVLVTVVASSGSTPRGAGARMIVGREGRICGTIGGGAVEYRSQQIAAAVLEERSSKEHDFSLTAQDVQKLGMICGGAVKVYFSFLPAYDESALRAADNAEAVFAKGQDMWMLSDLSDEGRIGIYSEETGFLGMEGCELLRSAMGRQPRRITTETSDIYIEQINSAGKVYVFGCGHVAQELVPVLQHVGFRCVAMDDRPEFASREVMPSAEEVLLIDFERISDYITVTEEDYVCVMTRGHGFDTVVQAQMVKTPACYIGVIGSRAKKAGVFRRLREEFGCTEAELEKITSPIGLSIGAETPAEIAVSIAGQMIELRARRNKRG